MKKKTHLVLWVSTIIVSGMLLSLADTKTEGYFIGVAIASVLILIEVSSKPPKP